MQKLNHVSKSAIALAVIAASSASVAQNRAMEEIIVSAEKREASVQDVPIAITAKSGEALKELEINQLQDLSSTVPSLTFSRAGGEGQLYIRGVGNNTLGIGVDPSVALHLDGVYLARTQMALSQFLDVERVEILRGPQGTLYGRNATGGSINIVSRQPGEEWQGYAQAYAGNFNRHSLEAAYGGPLSDVVGLRIAGRYIKDDGFTDDLDPRGGDKIDDQDSTALRATLAFAPSDTFSGSLAFDWADFDSGNRSIRPLDDSGIAQTLGALPLPAFDETRNNIPSYLNYESQGMRLELVWDLGDMTLTSLTGYRDYEDAFRFNTDGTELDVTETHYLRETDQLSQELRLASDTESDLRWQVGYFYFTEDKSEKLGLPNLQFAGFGNPNSFNLFATNDTDAQALFAQMEIDVTDDITIIVGGRYSDEEKDDWGDSTFSLNFDGLLNPANTNPSDPPLRERTDSWDDFSFKLGAQFAVDENAMMYATFSQGFKSGGTNSLATSPDGFDEESIDAYEVGFKGDFADGKLRANAALFFYDYSDLQVLSFVGGTTRIDNAASAEVSGIELETTALLTDNLTWNLGLTLLDAEYQGFISTFGVLPGGAPNVVDLTGNRLINAPKNKATTSLRYDLPLSAGGQLSFLGQLNFQGTVFFSKENEPLLSQDDLTLLDMRIAYTSANGRWELAAVGKNLTGEEYLQNAVRFTSMNDRTRQPSNIGHPLGYPGEGRSYGVQLGYKF